MKKTNTYGYDTTWKDKLTSYNGETITYDAIGNPLKYRNGMTMLWKNGRQLSQVKTSKDTITYKYNIKGFRTGVIIIVNIDSNGNSRGINYETKMFYIFYFTNYIDFIF